MVIQIYKFDRSCFPLQSNERVANAARSAINCTKLLFRFGCVTDMTSHVQLQGTYPEFQSLHACVFLDIPDMYLFCRLLPAPKVVEALLNTKQDAKEHSKYVWFLLDRSHFFNKMKAVKKN